MPPQKPLPEGNYDKKRCEYREDTLKCSCKTSAFSQIATQVQLPCDKGQVIENSEGKLECQYPLEDISSGNYQYSFHHCERRKNILKCHFEEHKSQIQVPCPYGTELVARNHDLFCLGLKKSLPNGYYKDLQNCEYRGDSLTCDQEKQKQTTLKLPCPDTQLITVYNGKLKCADAKTTLPSGTYLNSCSNCTAKEGILECDCLQNRKESKHHSKLVLPCYDVVNADGTLTCL